MRYYFLSLCLSVLLLPCLWAQSDVQFTHFMVNRMMYNPAFTGGKQVLDAAAVYRSQWWSGLDGAPRTFSVMAHTPLPKNAAHNVGISLVSDKIGLYEATLAALYYAWRINLSADGLQQLRVGASLRLDNWRADWSASRPIDLVDSELNGRAARSAKANMGLGIYYTYGKFYAGLSAPLLFANPLYEDKANFAASVLSYYFIVGSQMPLNEKVSFHPNVMMSINPGAPFEIDVNANFLLANALWLGASYRHGDSIDGLVGYEVGNGLRIGLSLDLTTSELKQVTTGSFEFLLGYTFQCEDCYVHSLRHF